MRAPDLMSRALAGALLGIAAVTASVPAAAGSSSGAVPVTITVTMPGYVGPPPMVGPTGTCVSESLSEETGAVVRVTCPGGVFVSISPRPGGRFVGTHGGAYSYYFGGSFGAVNRAGYGDFAQGSGTIASFRVYSVSQSDGPIDMLVSF
jgi:hypothetical protein